MYTLPLPFKLTHLKDLVGSASWGIWQGTGGPLCSAIRIVEILEGSLMASLGPEGRSTSCNVTSCSFGATVIVAVGVEQALLRACSEGKGAHQPCTLGKGAPQGGGANYLASWTLADMRSTNPLTGAPTMANSSSWSPLHSRGCMPFQLCHLLQLPQGLQRKKKKLMRILRKISLR